VINSVPQVWNTCFCNSASRLICCYILAFLSGFSDVAICQINHENCGVNSAIVVLLRFEKNVDGSRLSRLLKVSEDQSEQTSFASLAECFSEYGLRSYAFQGADIQDIIHYTGENCLAILQIVRGGQSHFLVARKANDSCVLVDDPPTIGLTESISEFAIGNASGFTGNVLFVSSSQLNELEVKSLQRDSGNSKNVVDSNKATNSSIGTPQIQPVKGKLLHGKSISIPDIIDLGQVSSRAKEVKCSVKITNESDEEIVIKQIKGTCSCFIGVEPFGNAIKPHSDKVLVFRFEPRKMRGHDGDALRSSLIVETTDAELPLVQLSIIGQLTNIEKWLILPSVIDLGTISRADYLKYQGRYAVLTRDPADSSNVEILSCPTNLKCSFQRLPDSEFKKEGIYWIYGFVIVSTLDSRLSLFDFSISVRNTNSGVTQPLELKGNIVN